MIFAYFSGDYVETKSTKDMTLLSQAEVVAKIEMRGTDLVVEVIKNRRGHSSEVKISLVNF